MQHHRGDVDPALVVADHHRVAIRQVFPALDLEPDPEQGVRLAQVGSAHPLQERRALEQDRGGNQPEPEEEDRHGEQGEERQPAQDGQPVRETTARRIGLDHGAIRAGSSRSRTG